MFLDTNLIFTGEPFPEIRRPRLELLDAQDEVGVPPGEAVEGGVGALRPGLGDLFKG